MASHCCGPLPWVLLSIVIVRVGSMKPQQLPLRALPFVPARIGWQRQSARMSAGALRSETADGTADGAEPANEPLAEELRSTRLPSLRIASPVTAIFLWACPLLALIGPGEHRLVLRTTLGMLQPAVYRIKPSVLNMKPVLLALAPTLTSDLSRGFSLLAVAPLLPTLLERVLYMLHALSQLGSRALSPGDTTPTDYRDSLLQAPQLPLALAAVVVALSWAAQLLVKASVASLVGGLSASAARSKLAWSASVVAHLERVRALTMTLATAWTALNLIDRLQSRYGAGDAIRESKIRYGWSKTNKDGERRPRQKPSSSSFTGTMSQTASLEQARANSLAKLASFFVFLFAFFGGASTLGVNVKAVLTFSGATGVVIGLAGRDMLANFIGGVTIYLSQPFTVGDWVHNVPKDQLSRPTLDGWVEQIGWYYTKINTWDKRPMYIPNAQFHSMMIINASRMSNRRILHTLRVRLQDRARLPAIIGDIKAALMANTNLDPRQHRLIYWRSVGEYSLDLWLSCFTRSVYLVDFLNVQQDLLFEIDRILDANGARFASNLAREQQILSIGGTDTSRLISAAATGPEPGSRGGQMATPARYLIDTRARSPSSTPTTSAAVLPNTPIRPEGHNWMEAETEAAKNVLYEKGERGTEKEAAGTSTAAAACLEVGDVDGPRTDKRRAAAMEVPALVAANLAAKKDFLAAVAAEAEREAQKVLQRRSEEEAAVEEAAALSEASMDAVEAAYQTEQELEERQGVIALREAVALREAALRDQVAAAAAREAALLAQAQAQALKEQESAACTAKTVLQQRLSALEGREAAIVGNLERSAEHLVGQDEVDVDVETRNTTEMREEAAKQQEASLRLMEAANLYKERSVARKENAIDAKAQALEQRERSLLAMQQAIDLEKEQVSELKDQVRDEVMGVVQAVVSAATIDTKTAATMAAEVAANAAAAVAAELELVEEVDKDMSATVTEPLALAEAGSVAEEVAAALASLQQELRLEDPSAGVEVGADKTLLEEMETYKGDEDDTVYIEEYERTQMGD